MAFRIFIASVALFALYLSFGIGITAWTKHRLLNPEQAFVSENTEADLSVVAFFDYSCEHCRSVSPILEEAVRRDGRIRFAIRPLESFRKEGTNAAKLAYAAAQQGQFFPAHRYLMENFRAINEGFIEQFAQEFSLDKAQLMEDYNSMKALEYAAYNEVALGEMRAQYVPSVMIGPHLIMTPRGEGQTSVQDFLRAFAEARSL